MPELAQDKYQLKTLHSEIDLFDRKLAHLLRFEAFANDADRDAAARRITLKRDQLARAARQMAQNGIEFSASELPRSFRVEDEAAAVEAAVPHEQPAAPEVKRKKKKA
ncbi:MAG TPA: hypothetical protein VHX60_09450 [Acidobacteriaceae bacterium]|jgi:hypothetical protein|nr:hypothetical protein [Acidobacteriaceae bacterium]